MKSILITLYLLAFSSATAQTSDTSLTKNNSVPVNTDSVYTKVDVEAQFPGGEKKWNKFAQKIIVENIDMLIRDEANKGTCTFRFIVDAEGNISVVRAMNMEKSTLAKTMILEIQKGPKWVPAKLNGVNVKSVREQKITLRF
jgi:protein TonB